MLRGSEIGDFGQFADSPYTAGEIKMAEMICDNVDKIELCYIDTDISQTIETEQAIVEFTAIFNVEKSTVCFSDADGRWYEQVGYDVSLADVTVDEILVLDTADDIFYEAERFHCKRVERIVRERMSL